MIFFSSPSTQTSDRIQTNTERLGYCVTLWDDLKLMEQDMNQWTTAGSMAELADLSEKDTEARLGAFQVSSYSKQCC